MGPLTILGEIRDRNVSFSEIYSDAEYAAIFFTQPNGQEDKLTPHS